MTRASRNEQLTAEVQFQLLDASPVSLEALQAEEIAIEIVNTKSEGEAMAATKVADELRPRAIEPLARAIARCEGQ